MTEKLSALARRIICLFRGHNYVVKSILKLQFSEAFMQTCDRCGSGEQDLVFARALAQKETSRD